MYLESYADLAIHEEMLKDEERVRAYRSCKKPLKVKGTCRNSVCFNRYILYRIIYI